MAHKGKATSLDLRAAVVAAHEKQGLTYEGIARLFGIGEASVSRYLRLYRETGSVARRPHGGGARPVLSKFDFRRLQALVERHPDWTTFEFLDEMNTGRARVVSRSTIVRALAKLGFTRKKSLSSPRSATRSASSAGAASTSKRSPRSPPTVWFIWTKPARRSR
jgi:transposase